MTYSKLLIQANQCHSLDDCYSFLTILAQSYCKNNILANDLINLASIMLATIPKKILKKSKIKILNQILDEQHVYALSKTKRILFSYAQKSLRVKNLSGTISSCQILQNLKDDFSPKYKPYFILRFTNEDNPKEESDVYSSRVKFDNILKILIELKYALKEQTANLAKIKDNTRDYYLKFENVFNYYKTNHSEPKTITKKLKNKFKRN